MESQVKVVKGSRLIDGTGNVVEDKVAVVVDGNRIQAAGPERTTPVPAEAEVIDATGATLMPGLIDCHLHLSEFNVLTFDNYRVARFEVSRPLQALYALFHAQICLEMGFTTLRDLGMITPTGLNVSEMVALRDAFDVGIVVGPRLKVAGWAAITNSHFDLVLPRSAPRDPAATADGPWELRRLVRSHLRAGADLIKTVITGGGGTDKEEPDVRNMTQEELEAIVDEAHAFHKRCACHCFTGEAQRRAVMAGVDTIEHCVWTDDGAIEMLKAAARIVVPTLAHRTDHAIDVRARMGSSQFTIEKMKRIQASAMESFQRLYRAGVKIAMGTDTQIDPEMGTNALELEVYVQLGMTPMEAILTATRNAAEALGLEREVGTLEPGKLADVIAVNGDPLQDVRLLQDRESIKVVMKDGQVYVDRREGQHQRVVLDGNWVRRLDEALGQRSRGEGVTEW